MLLNSPTRHRAGRPEPAIDVHIRRVVCAIPPGRVATYGQVAALAGLPRGARRAGRVLHDLPVGTAVPWQRVIKAGGWPAFPEDSEAYWRQRALLLQEGVEFTGQRIDLDRFGWRPALDELLFAIPPEG